MINLTSKTLNNKDIKFTKYLSTIVGCYCVFFILPTILLKRSIILPYFGVIPVSILFTGAYFVILDVITEVYGYFQAKKAIYAGLLTYSIFVFIMEGVLQIRTLPDSMTITKILNNQAYNVIFENIYITWVSVVICTLIFDILNIRLLSKWKFLLKGKYFFARTIVSSSFAILLFSFVTNFFAFYPQIIAEGISFYWNLNIVSISAKITSLVVFAFPAVFLSRYLKESEDINITTDVNIFLFNKED